jgi:hypothetical protein
MGLVSDHRSSGVSGSQVTTLVVLFFDHFIMLYTDSSARYNRVIDMKVDPCQNRASILHAEQAWKIAGLKLGS